MSSYLVNLIQQDLGAAQDNLHRAKIAAKHADPSKNWGESGETLQSILDGYQRRVNKAEAALAEAEQKGL